MEVRNGDDSGPSGAAGGVRERDGGSLSSSAPSTFNGFQQFQQQQQQQEEQNQQQQQTNRPGGSGTGSLHNGGDEQSAGGEQTPGDRAETGMAPQRELDPLTARLSAFRAKDIGCDVAFVVGDEKEKLKAHKLVLGASSPVFFAMFYGPLAAYSPQPPFRPTFGNQQNANNPPEHAPPAAVSNNASRVASRQSARGGEIGGQAQNGGDEEEYDEEEYEEEEAEEYEEGEADNLSNGSSSLTSSMEGASAAEQQRQQAGNEDPASSSQFHHRRQSLKAGHRNLAGANHQQQEDDEQLLKAELAASGLQMVRVPDCEPKAFAILLDFVYSDFDVHNLSNCCLLTEENVMNTLYAAKKYDIHALVAECVRYCTARLTATNAVSLLAQARMLDENTLVQQCYQVIDQNTDVALQAVNMADIDRNTLIDVLARNQLDPRSELVIFYAAKAWGEAECARRGIPATIENLRQCLGPAMQLIRFSLMDVNEFGQAASSSLLSCEEIAEVFLHLTVRPRPACRFAAQGFRANSRSKHIVQRFLSVSAKPRSRREHKVCFTADRDVLVSGLSVYGVFQANNKVYNDYPKSNWEHDVEIKLETSTDSPSIYGSALKLLASNTVQLSGKFGDPTPVMAYFTEPVPCQENVTYLATVHFKNETGVSTFQGKDGQDLVSVELPFDQTITFKFHSYRYGFDGGDGGRAEGQIPAIHFLIQWPTEAK